LQQPPAELLRRFSDETGGEIGRVLIYQRVQLGRERGDVLTCECDVTHALVAPGRWPVECLAADVGRKEADAIEANRFGIPTCVYGSGGGNRRSVDGKDPRAKEGEFVEIDDMVTHAATIMRAAMRLNDIGLDKTIAMRGPMPSVITTPRK